MKCETLYSAEKLSLSNVEPFAQGGNRLCFIHPDNPSLCIKVVKEGSIAALRARRGFFKNLRPDSALDDNIGEYKAYQQSAIIHGGDEVYDHLPRCYGWQETDMGQGLVSDYYAVGDKAAPPLLVYLQSHGMSDEVKRMLEEFSTWLRQTQILTKNIIPHNVVVAEDSKLKLIDGLGASSPLNIARFSQFVRRKYIEKRIKRMYLRVQWELSDKSQSWDIVETKDKSV